MSQIVTSLQGFLALLHYLLNKFYATVISFVQCRILKKIDLDLLIDSVRVFSNYAALLHLISLAILHPIDNILSLCLRPIAVVGIDVGAV